MHVRLSTVVRCLAAALLTAALVHSHLHAELRLTRQDADRFQTKLVQMTAFATTPASKSRRGRTTQITDAEVNSYLRFHAQKEIPVGIVDPILAAAGDGRVRGRATVDLDAVRTQKKRAWTDPLAYLTGQLPITASGTLTTENGVGRFRLDSADISGITIPKSVLQDLVGYYSRTPQKPSGINMDDPFELPARIREIRVGQGTATVIQ